MMEVFSNCYSWKGKRGDMSGEFLHVPRSTIPVYESESSHSTGYANDENYGQYHHDLRSSSPLPITTSSKRTGIESGEDYSMTVEMRLKTAEMLSLIQGSSSEDSNESLYGDAFDHAMLSSSYNVVDQKQISLAKIVDEDINRSTHSREEGHDYLVGESFEKDFRDDKHLVSPFHIPLEIPEHTETIFEMDI
mmetsp:Transcript_3586/g.5600  ORF Transcript_3586/g.5600 Transcript_3586/m.5600 type:complete len:192 (-) Transcript_3586:167-742(-)